jgi:hypothetical protein
MLCTDSFFTFGDFMLVIVLRAPDIFMQSEAKLSGELLLLLVQFELEDAVKHVVSGLTSFLTAYCGFFESFCRVLLCQLQNAFAGVVGLGFVDAAQ